MENETIYLKKEIETLKKVIERLTTCIRIIASDGFTDESMKLIREGEEIISVNYQIVKRIQNTIHEILGLPFSDYNSESKRTDLYFARLIFSHHCERHSIDPLKYITRNRTMRGYYQKKYRDEYGANPKFKQIADEVKTKLSETI